MDALVDAIAIGLLALWFAASVVQQLSAPGRQVLQRLDVLGLVPRWHFFAPNPGRHDVHLVVRDVGEEGCAAWVEVAVPPTSAAGRWIWNPEKHLRKALFDTVDALGGVQRTTADSPRSIILSAPYIRLLRWAMGPEPVQDGVTGRQFAIVTTQAHGPQQGVAVRFLSEIHPLAG